MGLTTTSVWIRRETAFRAGLAVGEPIITIESNVGAGDVQIFLGNSYAADGVSVTLDQLDRLAAAVDEARRLYLASLAAPVDPGTDADPTGPDDPTDEPTDEPAHVHEWTTRYWSDGRPWRLCDPCGHVELDPDATDEPTDEPTDEADELERAALRHAGILA